MQKSSVELQESRVVGLLQDVIEVQCMMQWGLLRYSAQSHLNKVLIRIGALRVCYDKTVNKAVETVFASPFWKRHTWSVFLETEMAMMVQYMQGREWRPDRDMKGGVWVVNLLCFPSHHSNFVCFLATSAGNGENCAPSAVDVICPLVVVVVRSGFPACNSRELLWHLLPGPVIGGQVCRVPPIKTAEWEEKKELSARTRKQDEFGQTQD